MAFKIGDVIENTAQTLLGGRTWRITSENGPSKFIIESVEFPGNTMSIDQPVWRLSEPPCSTESK